MRSTRSLSCLAAVLLVVLAVTPSAAAASEERSDVVVLTDGNFDELTATGSWIVEFYAPWCGHCKVLAPLYEEAATALKGTLQLGKLDATSNNAVSSRFGIKGFPHLKFLREGEVRNYNGARTTEGLVAFGREMAQPAVATLKSLEQFRRLPDTHPVSAVFFGNKNAAERRLFDSLAWRLQGSLKFYRVEYDAAADSVGAAIFSAAGVRVEQAPLVLLVTARADMQDEHNRFSGPWGAATPRAAGTQPEASSALGEGQSLRDWLLSRKLPLVSELDANNFDDLTTTGKRIVLAVVDAKNKGSATGAQQGQAFVDALYPLASRADLQSNYVFAQVDGPRYHKYISQFGVPVTDSVTGAAAAPADTHALPTLVVLEVEQDYYFAPPSTPAHPIGDAAAVTAFLEAVQRGDVPLSATLPWYNPSRYLKLLEKQMNTLPTWQLALMVGGFMLAVVGSLWWCCANGLDAALGLQLTPEEEEQLMLERERMRAVAAPKKRDGSGKATAASAAAATATATGDNEGLTKRKARQ